MRSMLRQYAKQLSQASAPAGAVSTTLDFETVFKHLAGPPATSAAGKKKKQKASVSKLTRDAFLKVISLELGLHVPKEYQEYLWAK